MIIWSELEVACKVELITVTVYFWNSQEVLALGIPEIFF